VGIAKPNTGGDSVVITLDATLERFVSGRQLSKLKRFDDWTTLCRNCTTPLRIGRKSASATAGDEAISGFGITRLAVDAARFPQDWSQGQLLQAVEPWV